MPKECEFIGYHQDELVVCEYYIADDWRSAIKAILRKRNAIHRWLPADESGDRWLQLTDPGDVIAVSEYIKPRWGRGAE